MERVGTGSAWANDQAARRCSVSHDGSPCSCERFSIDVPLSDGGKSGLYEVSVWASVPSTKDLVMVSLRTIKAK